MLKICIFLLSYYSFFMYGLTIQFNPSNPQNGHQIVAYLIPLEYRVWNELKKLIHKPRENRFYQKIMHMVITNPRMYAYFVKVIF
jgi:hypothetical protein